MELVISSRDQFHWCHDKVTSNTHKKCLRTSQVQQWDAATPPLLALKHHISIEFKRAVCGIK